jgi:hypothetical protein
MQTRWTDRLAHSSLEAIDWVCVHSAAAWASIYLVYDHGALSLIWNKIKLGKQNRIFFSLNPTKVSIVVLC